QRLWRKLRGAFQAQFAAYYGGQEFSCKPVVKHARRANGNRLQRFNLEGAVFDQPLKARDGHLIQPALHIGEALRTIVANVSAPTAQSFFGEDQMRPGKNRK